MERYRNDFPSLGQRRDGKPPIYFDNACTTLVPQPVIDAIGEYYAKYPGCGGRRSHHWFAEEVTSRVEDETAGSRRQIADFIHAPSEKEILFALNTTHALNAVALGFNFREGDTVLLTDREHNSNLIPWLRLQARGGVNVQCLPMGADEEFDLDALESRLKAGGVRLVSMGFTSNFTGYTIPAAEVVRLAHRYGARVLLDAAQTAPHRGIDVGALGVDMLAFSLHKMCGPRGLGVLYAKSELTGAGAKPPDEGADRLDPAVLGGGTVADATCGGYSLLAAPEGFEAGIPNYPAQIAAGAAVRYLGGVGMERIAARERELNGYLTAELLKRYGDAGWFRVFGPQDASKRGGVLTFEVRRPNSTGIATELDKKANIMVRDGVFCVHSYFNGQFGAGWQRPKSHRDHRMVYRVSLYFYNTLEECRTFVETLDAIFAERCYI
ncbi:MAG: aminotransferase class V-fold PLP-dependent enzyme [Acidobacteriota bacterium]|jgi:cysteine desulfurase/selenocysteine lyase|nr:aminotransferase class V-fold PLP-dependent enzyme [Acidobacteriota bacterium]